MGPKQQLDVLTIRNVSTLCQALKVMDEADKKFINFLNSAMAGLIKKLLPGWEIWPYFWTQGFNFWPPSWHFPENMYAYFQICLINCHTPYAISRLSWELGDESGVGFIIDPRLFVDAGQPAGSLLTNFYFDSEQFLRGNGFLCRTSDGLVYHPLRLELEQIAEGYPNWNEKTIEPFASLLQDIKNCQEFFNDFVGRITRKKLPPLAE